MEGRGPDLGQEREAARPRRLAMAYQLRLNGFGSCRLLCRRKLRLNRPSASTACGTRVCRAGRPDRSVSALSAQCRGRRARTARRSRRSRRRALESGWKRCGRSCAARGYRPKPLLRVWIPKSNGGQRPLGIPAIPRSCGPDGCAVGNRPHLRDGPAGEPVRFPTRDVMPRWPSVGLFAHHGPRTD